MADAAGSNANQFIFSGVQRVKISVATSGANSILSGVPGKIIRLLEWYMVTDAANKINWQSHVTTSNADGQQSFATNGGIVVGFSPIGWFDTTIGEGLDLVTTVSTQLGGMLSYQLV